MFSGGVKCDIEKTWVKMLSSQATIKVAGYCTKCANMKDNDNNTHTNMKLFWYFDC